VTAETDGNAHVIEAALGDEREVAGQHLAAPVAFVGCFQAIAEGDALFEVRGRRRRLAEGEGLDTAAAAL
jgi:hypothetical protein